MAMVLTWGCRDGNGKVPVAPPPAAEPPAAAKPLLPEVGGSSLEVIILPEQPMAGDVLQAVVRGAAGPPVFHWEVDGYSVAGAGGGRLLPGTAGKGQEVRLRVEEGAKQGEAATVIRNSPPRILAVPLVDAVIFRGRAIEVRPEVEDPDGDPVQFSYRWFVNGEELSFADGPTLTGDRFHRGDRVLAQIVPFDGEDQGPQFPALDLVIPNAPPVFASEPPATFQEEGYRYQAKAEDPDGDPVTYMLEAGPPGMAIDSVSGQVSWERQNIVAGEATVRIKASDLEGKSVWQEFTLTTTLP
jgi:hypothetical protein